MGFELVVVRVHGGSRPRLQVMAEPVDRHRGMTVDDCAEISHAVSAVLDVSDPIAGAYTLEVSSPGLDRPLVKRDDFIRFTGERARLETDTLIDGRRRFIGRIAGVEGECVVIDPEDGPVDGGGARIPIEALKRAKLALGEVLAPAPKEPAKGQKRNRKRGDGA
jgi:ribosome maturation factor RimP